MKILLSHGYFLEEDSREQEIMKPYPPLGLLYVSAWLEKNGFDNLVFDTTFSSKDELKEYLLENKPQIVALYTNLMTKINIVALIHFIRSSHLLKDTLIVLGGPDTTYNIENYLLAGADLLVIGEGEQTMLEIAQLHKNKDISWHSIKGIAFLQPDGSLMKTPSREKIKDLDTLPLPNRSKIDIERYLSTWEKYHGQRAISVSTQRGCPYTCRWCSTAVYGQSYRRRSAKSVVDELEYLQDTYNPEQIWFVDDVFTVSHRWIEAFHAEMGVRNLKIAFECITRAERLDDRILGLLKACGCFRIWIGAESGSQQILNAMDRKVEINKVSNVIKSTKRMGMETGTFIMVGYPGETDNDIIQTRDYLTDALPDLVTYTVAYPIKGTGLYLDVENKIISQQQWSVSTDRQIDFVRTYPRLYYDFALRWLQSSHSLQILKRRVDNMGFNSLRLTFKVFLLRVGMLFFRRKSGIQNVIHP